MKNSEDINCQVPVLVWRLSLLVSATVSLEIWFIVLVPWVDESAATDMVVQSAWGHCLVPYAFPGTLIVWNTVVNFFHTQVQCFPEPHWVSILSVVHKVLISPSPCSHLLFPVDNIHLDEWEMVRYCFDLYLLIIKWCWPTKNNIMLFSGQWEIIRLSDIQKDKCYMFSPDL